jgi:uncharacterized phage-associated protein
MPNHSPLAIANEFLRLRGEPLVPAQMQLQKWIYLAHGWNLAINQLPLVNDQPEAWDGGPVFRSIWNHIRDFGYGVVSRRLEVNGQPYVAPLNENERRIIDLVWDKYRGFTGYELSEMTHQPDTPWTHAYFQRGRNARISNRDTQNYYTALALAGRE